MVVRRGVWLWRDSHNKCAQRFTPQHPPCLLLHPITCAGGGASMMAGLSALATLAQGGQPDAAFSRALGMAVLQQAAGSLIPGLTSGPNGLSLAASLELLQSVSAGQPMCLMTEVDAAGLGSSSVGVAAGGVSSGGAWGLGGGEGGLFEEGEEGGVLGGFMSKLEEAVEQVL